MDSQSNNQQEIKIVKSKRRQMDLLQGSLVDKILLFVFPLALTGILQQLFNAADTAIVGQMVSAHAMGAVGLNGPVVALVVNLFIGIAIGTNVRISFAIGAKDRQAVRDTVHTSILFALVCGIILAFAVQPFLSPLMTAMGVPEDIFDMSLTYIRIYMGGLPVILLYNFEAAIFRSIGDTRTPLICLVISGFANVGLNVFFIKAFGMAGEGVALATVLANAISAVILLVLLMRRQDDLRLNLSELRIKGYALKPILRIGLPAGIQSIFFSVSNIIVQSAINSLGANIVAASSAAFNIELLTYFFYNSFGQAATTFIGQNHGAGNIPRCRQVTRRCLGLSLIVAIILPLLLYFNGAALLSMFNPDPYIIQYGLIRLALITLPSGVNCLLEVFSGSLRGYGFSTPPAVIAFVGVCGFRIAWIYTAFPANPTFDTILWSYPISWVITDIAIIAAYFIFMRRLTKKQA